jgi:hypothetical protein
MRKLTRFLLALEAPLYALFGGYPNFVAEEYHISVWFFITMVASMLQLIPESWIGWSEDKRTHIAVLALIATLVCRLAVVERYVGELRRAAETKAHEEMTAEEMTAYHQPASGSTTYPGLSRN